MMLSNGLILGYSNMLKQSKLSKQKNEMNDINIPYSLKETTEEFKHFSPREDAVYTNDIKACPKKTTLEEALQSAFFAVLAAGSDVTDLQLDYLKKMILITQSLQNNCNLDMLSTNVDTILLDAATETLNILTQTHWIEENRLRRYFESEIGIIRSDSCRYAKQCIKNDILNYQSLVINFRNPKYTHIFSSFSAEHIYLIETHSKSSPYLYRLIKTIHNKNMNNLDQIYKAKKAISSCDSKRLHNYYKPTNDVDDDDQLSYEQLSMKNAINSYQVETGLLWSYPFQSTPYYREYNYATSGSIGDDNNVSPSCTISKDHSQESLDSWIKMQLELDDSSSELSDTATFESLSSSSSSASIMDGNDYNFVNYSSSINTYICSIREPYPV